MFNRTLLILSFICLISCTKEIIQQKLTVSVTPANGGTVSPPSNSYEKGSNVSLVATPTGEYLFKQWQGSISGTSNPTSITMDADKSVTGVFEKKAIFPSVSIGDSPIITSITSADFLIKIIDNGGAQLINSGLCWSLSPNPTINDFKSLNLDNKVSESTISMKGLLGGKSYYVSAFATNSAGTSYSTVKTFKTQNSIMIDQCKLPEMMTRGDVGIGFPKIANRIRSTGTVKVNVIFVDFSDAAASKTTQQVFNILSPTSENYFTTVSYGKLNIQFNATYKWYRMSKASNQYGWDNLSFALHKQYIQEAISLADRDVDFSGSDSFIIIANPDATNLKNGPALTASLGQGIKADGKEFLNSATSGYDLNVWGGLWFNHEFGHNMTLADLYAYQGNAHRFVGEFSIMGLISGAGQDLFAWEKWILGWITDDQIVCVNTTNSAYLTPIEVTGGIKMLTLPISKTAAIVVESRRKIGYDSKISKEGPLAYIIDTNIASGKGTIKVLPIDETDTRKLNSPMTVGQEIKYLNYTIKYISSDSNGDLVEILSK
jgi:M6 family metalloprotease-like protein